jgi:hypothetical protein
MHWSAKAKKMILSAVFHLGGLTLYNNHYCVNLQKKIGFGKSGGAGQHLFEGPGGQAAGSSGMIIAGTTRVVFWGVVRSLGEKRRREILIDR